MTLTSNDLNSHKNKFSLGYSKIVFFFLSVEKLHIHLDQIISLLGFKLWTYVWLQIFCLWIEKKCNIA